MHEEQQMMSQDGQGLLMTDDTYFVPPPINQSNKNYIQQLEANQNSIKNLTKYYSCFNTLFTFDCETNITPEVKLKLREYNLGIYTKMRQLLASVGGDTPAKANADVVELKRQATEFIALCGSIKVFQTRLEIYKMMANETNLIKQRTAQITSQFEQIKQELKKVTSNQAVMNERVPE